MTVTVVEENGDPLQGEISMIATGYSVTLTEETNADGVATFEDLPDETDMGDSYTAEFDADVDSYLVSEGRSDFTTTIQGGEANKHTLNLVEVPAVHDVSVTVTDEATGNPIEGTTVTANGGHHPAGGDKVFEGTTGADGAYSTTAAEGQHEIMAYHGAYYGSTETVMIDGDTETSIVLESAHLSPPDNETESNETNESNTTDANLVVV